MTKKTLSQLQVAISMLDKAADIKATDTPTNNLRIDAQLAAQCIQRIITTVQKSMGDFIEHPYWSQHLHDDVKRGRINKAMLYQVDFNEMLPGHFLLTMTEINSSRVTNRYAYPYYESREQISEDLAELRKIGIDLIMWVSMECQRFIPPLIYIPKK